MNTLKISILLLAAITLFSCQKDEDVKPATNPRFSVAYVQNIDASGVEFAANVFEFGSEEILEYGFVYDRQINPSIEKSDVVKAVGKPGQTFELKATTPLANGPTIYVAAFIKTSQKIVYSEQMQFKSSGSGTFFIEDISYAEEIYFGDTITITGNNFGKDLSNFRIYVNNKITFHFGLTSGSFKILFPYEVSGSFEQKQAELPIKIEIAGQSKEFRKLFNLKDPVLRQPDFTKVNYRDQVTLYGDYLYGGKIFVKYDDGMSQELLPNPNDLRIPAYSEYSKSKSPAISVSIRGKTFDLGRIFELNPTELVPGQEIILDPYKIQELKGINFHPGTEGNNLVTADGKPFYVTKMSQYAEAIYMYLPAEGAYPNRKKELFVENYGMSSKNAFTIINNQPYVLVLEDQSIPSLDYSKSITMDGVGYMFAGQNIYRIDFNNGFETRLDARIPEKNKEYSFVVPLNGELYFGAATDGWTDSRNFFKYNPVTRTFSDLPDLPARMGVPRKIYEGDGKFIFEAGYFSLNDTDRGYSKERHQYNPVSKTWNKIDEQSSDNPFIINGLVFEHQGEIYSMALNYDESRVFIERLNKNELRWEYVFDTFYTDMKYNTIYRLNGQILVKDSNGLKSINFENKSFDDYPINISHPLFSRFINGLTFHHNSKLYTYSNGLIEFDPAYNQ